MVKGSSQQPVLQLTVIEGPVQGLQAAKQSARFVLGRRKGLGFSVPDSAVSERHAEFTWTGTGYALRDLGSSNGSWRNGKRIREGQSVNLQDQDLLKLGCETLVRVEIQKARASVENLTVEEFLISTAGMMKQRVQQRGQVSCELLRNVLAELHEEQDEE